MKKRFVKRMCAYLLAALILSGTALADAVRREGEGGFRLRLPEAWDFWEEEMRVEDDWLYGVRYVGNGRLDVEVRPAQAQSLEEMEEALMEELQAWAEGNNQRLSGVEYQTFGNRTYFCGTVTGAKAGGWASQFMVSDRTDRYFCLGGGHLYQLTMNRVSEKDAQLILRTLAIGGTGEKSGARIARRGDKIYNGRKWKVELSELLIETAGLVFAPEWTVEINAASDEEGKNAWLEVAVILGDTRPLVLQAEYEDDLLRWTVEGSDEYMEADGDEAALLLVQQDFVEEPTGVSEFLELMDVALLHPNIGMQGIGERQAERDYRILTEEDGFKLRYRLIWDEDEELEKPFDFTGLSRRSYSAAEEMWASDNMLIQAEIGLMRLMADKDTARMTVILMNQDGEEMEIEAGPDAVVVPMRGHYMKPTFMDGDMLLLTEKGEFERGDIVAFQWEDNRWHVSRIIALGGERVYVEGDYGMVWVDGKRLDEPYLAETAWGAQIGTDGVLTVPEGCVFLLGDNRRLVVAADAPERGILAVSMIGGTVEEAVK